MAWEHRARGGWYYTRSRRVGGRVTREYVGGGQAGALAEVEDRARRGARAAERAVLRGERERWETVEEAIADVSRATDMMARCTLLLAGYHQHHRGAWRRWRGQ